MLICKSRRNEDKRQYALRLCIYEYKQVYWLYENLEKYVIVSRDNSLAYIRNDRK